MATKRKFDESLRDDEISGALKIVRGVVASTIIEHGVFYAESSVTHQLSQLFEMFMRELCQLCKEYCELSGRTLPIPADLIMSYAHLGRDIHDVPDFAYRPNRTIIPEPQYEIAEPEPKMLISSLRKPHFSYIPDHFPPFPPAYTYMNTPTYRMPCVDYETLHEKTSLQRFQCCDSLSQFIANSPYSVFNHSMFTDPTDEAI